MTEVWMYVVAASKDPDFIRCKVPWRVDKELIFLAHARSSFARASAGSSCDGQ